MRQNPFEQVLGGFSAEAMEFIEASVGLRDRLEREKEAQRQRELEQERKARKVAQRITSVTIGGVLMAGLAAFAVMQERQARMQQVEAMRSSAAAMLASGANLESVIESLRLAKTLQQSFWQVVWMKVELRGQVLDQLSQTVYATQEWNRFGERNYLGLHRGRVTAVAFSPDGKTLASASYDKTVKLRKLAGWDDFMGAGCNWVRDYLENNPLENNPNVAETDRHLCDGIGTTPRPDQVSEPSPTPTSSASLNVTPSPANASFNQVVNQATEAAKLTQTAKTAEQWNIVATHWQ